MKCLPGWSSPLQERRGTCTTRALRCRSAASASTRTYLLACPRAFSSCGVQPTPSIPPKPHGSCTLRDAQPKSACLNVRGLRRRSTKAHRPHLHLIRHLSPASYSSRHSILDILILSPLPHAGYQRTAHGGPTCPCAPESAYFVCTRARTNRGVQLRQATTANDDCDTDSRDDRAGRLPHRPSLARRRDPAACVRSRTRRRQRRRATTAQRPSTLRRHFISI